MEGLLIERWRNIEGKGLDDIENSTRFSANPDSRSRLASDRFESPVNVGSQFLMRIR